MIDVLEEIRDFIKTKPAITAYTEDRIYAGRNVPPPGYEPANGQAIAFRVRGGLPQYDDAVLGVSVQVKIYGETEVEANELYRVFYDQMHNSAGSVVRYAMCEQIGSTLSEPDTEWIFVLTYFGFVIRMEVTEL